MSVRHQWTDEQMRQCLKLIRQRYRLRNAFFVGKADPGYFKWIAERDVCVELLEGTPWMESAFKEKLVHKHGNGKIRPINNKWNSATGNPVRNFMQRIARELKESIPGQNSYYLAGARAHWTEPGDMEANVKGSFMAKYPYYFELKELLLAARRRGPVGERPVPSGRKAKLIRTWSPKRGQGAADTMGADNSAGGSGTQNEEVADRVEPVGERYPDPDLELESEPAGDAANGLPLPVNGTQQPIHAPDPAPDSDSDIEFVAFHDPSSAGPSTAPRSPIASRKRKFSEVAESDDEVEFVAEGTFMVTESSDARKTRSVLTGTYVQSGPPPEGWDSVNLWTLDSDNEEDATTAPSAPQATVPAPTTPPNTRSTRVLRSATRVNYAEPVLNYEDDSDRDSDYAPPEGAPASSQIGTTASSRVPAPASSRVAAGSRIRLPVISWLTDAASSYAGHLYAVPMPQIHKQLYKARVISGIAPELSQFPTVSKPLADARQLNGARRSQLDCYLQAFRSLFVDEAWRPEYPFLKDWVVVAGANREPVVGDALTIAAACGARVDITQTPPRITTHRVEHAYYLGKFCSGNVDKPSCIFQGKKGVKFSNITVHCLLRAIDHHLDTYLTSRNT